MRERRRNTASSLLSDGISIDQSANTTFRLPGYGGPPDDVDLVRAFLAGLNPATPDTISATTDFPLAGGGLVGGAPCALPTDRSSKALKSRAEGG